MSDQDYSWITFYRLLAEHIHKFQEDQRSLVNILIEIGIKGLNDKSQNGETFPLEEIDPFTVFAAFNKYAPFRRQKILQKFCEAAGISETPPNTFPGVPRSNPNNFWYFPYQFERDEKHIPLLWQLFSLTLFNEEDPELYDRVLRLKFIGEAKLSTGLFWVNPLHHLPLNSQTTNYFLRHNIESNLKGFERYNDFRNKAIEMHPQKNFPEISQLAWQENNDIVEAITNPDNGKPKTKQNPSLEEKLQEEVSQSELGKETEETETPAADEPSDSIPLTPENLPTNQKLVTPHADLVSKVDLLGRAPLVNVLKGIVDHKDYQHLVVGLFGRWGSGKSSVISLLKHKFIDDPNAHFMVFNAWQNEHSQNMGAAIANLMVKELYEEKPLPDQLLLTFTQQFLLQKNRIQIALLYITVAVVFAIFFSYGMAASHMKTMGLTALCTSAWPLIKMILSNPFTSKLKALTKKPQFTQHLGLAHDIKQQVGALLKSHSYSLKEQLFKHMSPSTISKKKYIIVIDDLDRCSDEKIVAVLEAIQLIVNLPNVIVIIAVDHEMLLQAVATRYCKQRDLDRDKAIIVARHYLGKIIQLSAELDAPSAKHRQRFIDERLYKDHIEKVAIPDGDSSVDNDGQSHEEDQPPVRSENIVESTQQKIKDSTEPEDMEDINYTDAEVDIDEDEWTYEESDEYLEDTPEEAAVFSRCVGTFDIHNPRTMIRIHNTITLFKGLHPIFNDDPEKLYQYMFLTFWLEWVAGMTAEDRAYASKSLDEKISSNDKNSTPTIEPRLAKAISELAEEYGLHAMTVEQKTQSIARVRKLSLPYT